MTDQNCFESFSNWLLGDHLGSTSMVADESGNVVSEVRYSAFGEIRYQSTQTVTTDYLYTGQRQEAEIGLYYYVARWYDPAIGRFMQADSVVPDPGSALGYDRYSYTLNNPVKYIDPSGHRSILTQYSVMETDGGGGRNYVNPYTGHDVGDVLDDIDDLLKNMTMRKYADTGGTELGGDLEITFQGISLSITFADGVADAMDEAPFTFKSIIWKIPNMIGGNYNIYEFTFLKGVSSGEIRNLGRAVGEDLAGPVAFTAGWLLTVTPNLVENAMTDASFEEFYDEFTVDTVGFLASEMVGDAVQGGLAGVVSPWVSVPLGVGADYGAGRLWDLFWYGE